MYQQKKPGFCNRGVAVNHPNGIFWYPGPEWVQEERVDPRPILQEAIAVRTKRAWRGENWFLPTGNKFDLYLEKTALHVSLRGTKGDKESDYQGQKSFCIHDVSSLFFWIGRLVPMTNLATRARKLIDAHAAR